MTIDTAMEIQNFYEQWNDVSGMKALCNSLHSHMASFAGLHIGFVARPGVSYSIRLLVRGTEAVVALLDVIDDDPEDRWLSLCFPDAIITDPDEEGDLVPNGLNGNDARCFSIDTMTDTVKGYLKARLGEAAGAKV